MTSCVPEKTCLRQRYKNGDGCLLGDLCIVAKNRKKKETKEFARNIVRGIGLEKSYCHAGQKRNAHTSYFGVKQEGPQSSASSTCKRTFGEFPIRCLSGDTRPIEDLKVGELGTPLAKRPRASMLLGVQQPCGDCGRQPLERRPGALTSAGRMRITAQFEGSRWRRRRSASAPRCRPPPS